MATRTQAKGHHVILGTVTVQCFKALVWWVVDQKKHSLPLEVANFTVEVMDQAGTERMLHEELATKELGKYNPDDFNAYEDAFLNMLQQSFGILKEPFCYVVCPDEVPAKFATTQEAQMFQLLLTGDTFEMDNAAVYRKLKEFFIDLLRWACIEPHDVAEN